MAEVVAFTTWLKDQGLRSETAQAVVIDLGIKSRKLLQICVESDSLRAELFSCAKGRFPFATYAEIRSFMERRVVRLEGSTLVEILCSMLDALSKELSVCAQKLISLQSSCASDMEDSGCVDGADGLLGIRINDVYTLHHEEGEVTPETENPVMVGAFHSDNPPTPREAILTVVANQEPCEPLIEESRNPESPEAENLMMAGAFKSNNPSTLQEAIPTVVAKQEPCEPLIEESRNPESPEAVETPNDISQLMASQDASAMYTCCYCQYSTKLKRKFYNHVKVHKEENVYKCNVCAKAFVRLWDVQGHMRSHTGERPFKCSFCGKGYSHLANMKIHVRSHTGEQPYKCNFCGKGFRRLWDLKVHRRSHTGEHPYRCSVCGKGFTQLGNMNVHMRSHTGEQRYKCSYCAKGFSHIAVMNVHIRSHTGEHPFKCSVCGKSFRHSGHMKVHMRKHTSETNTLG
uniref:C2H2-type domain-containing protein n=1 Tax=Eptatretus burgeri TaxID=7764 RepID=A0A8C4Q314_EPTBU